MVEKKEKDRNTQNEFLAKIQRCLNMYDEADKAYDEIEDFVENIMPNEQRKYNNKQQDYLHLLENYKLTDEQILAIGKKIEENRSDRRNWDNIAQISFAWKTHKQKASNRNTRIFLRNQIAIAVKKLDKDWTVKALPKEEIDKLFNNPNDVKNKEPKKRGRKSTLPEGTIDYILEQHKKGIKTKDIAQELSMKLNTVYCLINRNKDKVV